MDEYLTERIKEYMKSENVTLTAEQFEDVLNGVSYSIMSALDDNISDAVVAALNK